MNPRNNRSNFFPIQEKGFAPDPTRIVFGGEARECYGK